MCPAQTDLSEMFEPGHHSAVDFQHLMPGGGHRTGQGIFTVRLPR